MSRTRNRQVGGLDFAIFEFTKPFSIYENVGVATSKKILSASWWNNSPLKYWLFGYFGAWWGPEMALGIIKIGKKFHIFWF